LLATSNPERHQFPGDTNMKITAHTQQIIARVRRIWHELDHAQRRSLDLRTDVTEVERQDW
jgi:hypothetical protein